MKAGKIVVISAPYIGHCISEKLIILLVQAGKPIRHRRENSSCLSGGSSPARIMKLGVTLCALRANKQRIINLGTHQARVKVDVYLYQIRLIAHGICRGTAQNSPYRLCVHLTGFDITYPLPYLFYNKGNPCDSVFGNLNMFERVLICTDFSDSMQRFAAFIPDLGIAGIKHIVFLHSVILEDKGVITKVNDEKIEEVKAKLTKSIGDIPPGMEVKIEVLSGKAVDKIIKVAQSYQSQLIILGSQARPIIAEKLIGSTMAELSHKTTIPLLVLRPQLISTYTSEELSLRCQHLFRSLLIPYNNSEAANYLLSQIKELAKKQLNNYLENCVLCWITKGSNARDISHNYSFEEIGDILLKEKINLEEANLQVTTEIREGSPVSSILEAGKIFDVSAIAVSTATIGKPQEWFVSSFAAEILRESWHPILFIPPQRK